MTPRRLDSFERRTLQFLQHHHVVVSEKTLGAAVSGGPDSVALLNVLCSLKPHLGYRTLKVIHFDHRLRGEESTADRRFVEKCASHLGLEVVVGCGDVRRVQRERKVSLEMAARQCRRDFFLDLVRRGEVERIAVGHTADDQAEEILLRLWRGTGPSGMQGMRPETGEGLLRPLLWAHREDIFGYLKARRLAFREDATNREGFCQRNRLRHEVFPLLEQIFHPKIRNVLCRHADLAALEENFWNEQVNQVWDAVVRSEAAHTVVLDVPSMRALHEALSLRVFRRALEKMGCSFGIFAVHWQSLEGLLRRSSSGRELRLPRGIRAVREGTALVLTTRVAEKPPLRPHEFSVPGRYLLTDFGAEIWIETLHDSLNTVESGLLLLREKHRADLLMALMDAESLRWPLVVRSFKPGDRFRPLGARGSKKLQDFFTDAKVPRRLRARVPLLCDQEKICWVVGYRLDDRVKVTHHTQRILKMRWRPLG
ncbi:tRNA lysidine(34) synthetase TilS [Desulfosoma caldarium]|uniref:tRNA(Ile)-lysidine synthase n=1 Tax=Desulfosoma caldarium TaxID=610254 RepID=A0A3N1UHK4_9BACT|nr:tRNA lysidine(34) synthetase TilS [Desulfosoma caldarium]ROQ90734.1 tRNA(Ile)-lysidine synthase [Desulfosoma caldarium]